MLQNSRIFEGRVFDHNYSLQNTECRGCIWRVFFDTVVAILWLFTKGLERFTIETWIDRFRKSPWLLSFEMWETLWQIFEAFRHFYSCLCFALLYWNLKILCIVSENMFLVFELFTERSGWEQLWCIQFTLLPVSYFAFYFGNYDTYFLKFCKIKDIFSKFPKFGVYDMIWRDDVFS